MPCRTHVLSGRAALPMCHRCDYARTGDERAERACSGITATDLALTFRREAVS